MKPQFYIYPEKKLSAVPLISGYEMTENVSVEFDIPSELTTYFMRNIFPQKKRLLIRTLDGTNTGITIPKNHEIDLIGGCKKTHIIIRIL